LKNGIGFLGNDKCEIKIKNIKMNKEEMLNIIKKYLKGIDPFAYEAIKCLFIQNNDKAAFMVWSHYQEYYNIQLSNEEFYVEQKWYYGFVTRSTAPAVECISDSK